MRRLLFLGLAMPPHIYADLRLDGGAQYGWQTNLWRAQVDGVMGGQSSGTLSFVESNTIMSFSGDVVLVGGGFSSVRKLFDNALDISPYAGIVVTMETTLGYDPEDIQPPLGLHLQFHDTVSRYYGFASAFAVPISSTRGEETSIYLPLSSFDRGSRMGFTCSNCQLDFTSVDEMDIYVLFQSGPFDIRVKSIAAVFTPIDYTSPIVDITSVNEVRDLIYSTIQSGGRLYDYGYIELCIAIYKSTLNTLLHANKSDDVSQTMIEDYICQGLQRAETRTSKTDKAWTLRNIMDEILENLGVIDSGEGSGWPATAVGVTADQCKGAIPTTKPITLVLSNTPTMNDGKYSTPTTSTFAVAGDYHIIPTSKSTSEPNFETPSPTFRELPIIANEAESAENPSSPTSNSNRSHLGLAVALFGSWLSVSL